MKGQWLVPIVFAALLVLYWYLNSKPQKKPGLHPLTKWVLGIAGVVVVVATVGYLIAIQVSPS